MINKLLEQFNNLSIIKKVMLAPIIATVFGLAYLFFIYSQTNAIYSNSKKLEEVLIPLLEMSSQNRTHFRQITEIFTFAVSTGEPAYLQNSRVYIKEIQSNLSWIEKNYPEKNTLQATQKVFNKYLKIIKRITIKMRQEPMETLYEEELAEAVFEASKSVREDFDTLHVKIKELISKENNKTNKKIKFLLENGVYTAVAFYLFLVLLSFIGYHSIKNGFEKLMTSISQKEDIHEGIAHFTSDEFGILSDKFHSVVDSLNKMEKEKNKVEDISRKDQLTSLYNRHYFEQILQEVHRQYTTNNTVYGILILDIDFFKSINDTHGHLIGDEVLKKIASLFKKIIREEDIIARWGGEEFIILIQNINEKQLFEIAEKFRKSIETLKVPPVKEVTASLGGGCIMPNLTTKELIKTADDALYKAKKLGRNRVIIY